VVDDELVVRKVLGQMLAKMGFETDCAGDGVEAIEAINRVPAAYRMVIMDLTMPRMGGYEACDKIREQGCSIPIVFMSGYNAHEATDERGEEPKIAGFLHKPFSFPQLQALLESVLQSGNPGR
jgi:CheY-like chemotaxis protein